MEFFKIFNQSIKSVLKNAKCMAAITALSLLPSSILLLIYSCVHSTAINFMINFTKNPDANYIIPRLIASSIVFFAIELTIVFAFTRIVLASGIATIVATVASHSDAKLSLRDLYSSSKAAWKRPRYVYSGSRKPLHFALLFIVAAALGVAIPLVIFNPNPVRIVAVSVAGISVFVYSVYESVPAALASVIPVVEGCGAAEATEKAERLVEGRRLDGFMVTLLLSLVCVGGGFGFWMILGDKGRLNLMVYGLLYVVVLSTWMIVASVVHTVYYFRCMEYHGEKVQIGNFHYTVVAKDITA